MKNRNFIKIGFCVSLLFIAFSCKENEEDLSYRTYEYKNPPQFVSSIPESNSLISNLTEKIEIKFDKKVTVADLSKISLNGESFSEYAESDNDSIIILEFEKLFAGANYTLCIEKGAIKGIPGVLNTEDIEIKLAIDGTLQITNNLVMANSFPEAKKLYTFLKENYGKKIVSGAMAKVDWNITEAQRIHTWTGKYPAMNTFDYIHHSETWIDYTNTQVAEDWWSNNGIVSVMWHWNVPVSAGSNSKSFYTNETSFDVSQAVIDGTDENIIIKKDLDIVADYLLLLQAKNIPVIWRPLHEGAGGWFWWGAKGHSAYKDLWKLMFSTFKAKGIKNLIWVWTTENDDSSWYPGNAYVDIIGRDLYNNTDEKVLFKEFWAAQRAYPNKIIALSECGTVANITEQWDADAKWSWFMPWYDSSAGNDGSHAHAGKDFWLNAFGSDKVITREDMPSLK